jgi:hypothetical protein
MYRGLIVMDSYVTVCVFVAVEMSNGVLSLSYRRDWCLKPDGQSADRGTVQQDKWNLLQYGMVRAMTLARLQMG